MLVDIARFAEAFDEPTGEIGDRPVIADRHLDQRMQQARFRAALTIYRRRRQEPPNLGKARLGAMPEAHPHDKGPQQVLRAFAEVAVFLVVFADQGIGEGEAIIGKAG
jgi:hypothetical protein